MGGENFSLNDSLNIHLCIWGKGMVRNRGHQPWHHPDIPEPPLIPSAGLSHALCRNSPFQGFSGTWHWAVAGGKETPKPPELGFSSSVRTGVAGVVSTHLFSLVVFAKMGRTPRQRLWLRGAQIFGSLRAGQNPLRSQ